MAEDAILAPHILHLWLSERTASPCGGDVGWRYGPHRLGYAGTNRVPWGRPLKPCGHGRLEDVGAVRSAEDLFSFDISIGDSPMSAPVRYLFGL